MLKQYDLERFKSIDAIMVLGGEHSTPEFNKKGNPVILNNEYTFEVPTHVLKGPRSALGLELYKKLSKKRDSILYNVLTGRCSGLRAKDVQPHETEAVKMGLYYLAHGVDIDTLVLEDDSLDTISNFVLTKPDLEERGLRNIALIADEFGMPRALNTGKRVLGSKYHLEPLAVPEEPGNSLVELAVRATQFIDQYLIAVYHFGHHIETGNQQHWEKYLKEMHPFHAKDPHFGLYTWCALKMKQQRSAPNNYQLEES
jgi:uncharacterized SAM-binding protein YcdF (DUF218 family)